MLSAHYETSTLRRDRSVASATCNTTEILLLFIDRRRDSVEVQKTQTRSRNVSYTHMFAELSQNTKFLYCFFWGGSI